MAETLTRHGQWHLVLAVDDLVEQAGLSRDDIMPDIGHIRYKGRKVIVSHIVSKELVVSIEGNKDPEALTLMAGFARVVGYAPFAEYMLPVAGRLLYTREWDRVDQQGRYNALKRDEETIGLLLLE